MNDMHMTTSSENVPSIEALLYHAESRGVLPITSRCNMGCIFCSNAYNPPTCEVFDIGVRDYADIRDTIAWLQGAPGAIAIGESVTRINEGEPFTHPRFMDIMHLVRKTYPDREIRVTTNGSLLTRDTIKELSRFKISLTVSVNTVGKRKEVMGDPDPSGTLSNIQALRGKVQFDGSIVAVPFITGWDDLRETVRFLKEAGAQTVRLLAPGFSRFHPLSGEMPPDTWERLRAEASELSRRFRIPVLVEPPGLCDLEPRIEHVLERSPARYAGLQQGDTILAVEGRDVFSRKEAFDLAWEWEDPLVTVNREGGTVHIRIKKGRRSSPGFIMYEDLDADKWFDWERRSGARVRRVLILTSHIAKPIIEAALQRRGISAAVHPVRSRFFGGNIMAAGLLTVGDFLEAYQEVADSGHKPDLVTLPARAFDPWGRDLEGVHFRVFAERSGCPVILAG